MSQDALENAERMDGGDELTGAAGPDVSVEVDSEAPPVDALSEALAEAPSDDAGDVDGIAPADAAPFEAVGDLMPIIEAVVFAATKPVTLQQLQKLTGAPAPQLGEALALLRARYSGGIELGDVSGGYQFRTKPELAHWVRRMLTGKPQRLSRAMLETLAIVAYRQPITRPEIDDIRGVDCGGTLRVLLERNLVRILGKKEDVGRPLLYGTTKHFLEFFQLKDLKGLPTLREFAELSEEHRQEVEDRFGGAPADADSLADAPALEGPPERAAFEAAAALARAAGGFTPAAGSTAGADGAESSAVIDPQEQDEELMAVLDKALARADELLKRPEEQEEPDPVAAEDAPPDSEAREDAS